MKTRFVNILLDRYTCFSCFFIICEHASLLGEFLFEDYKNTLSTRWRK